MAIIYGDASIGQLLGADRIRKRPASMLGSSGLAGARHGVWEIGGNALDEHSVGYGNRLDVIYYKDGSVSVRDYGRGVPLGWNEKFSNWNWHIIYNELYGGGKYETYQEELKAITDWSKFNPLDYNYLFSVGLNGLGAASTQYTSEFFYVKSYRQGVCKSRGFKRGIPLVDGEAFNMFVASLEEIEKIPEEVCETDEPDGTFIHWKPDNTVFTDTNLGSDWLLEAFMDMCGVAGIELHFYDEATDKSVVVPAGTLNDLLVWHAGKKLLTDEDGNPQMFNMSAFRHGVTQIGQKEAMSDFVWICKCEIAMGITKGEAKNYCYHNSVKMASGVQYDAIESAVREFLQERGAASGVKVEWRDCDGVVSVAVSTYSNYASFRNQTKDAVDDAFIFSIVKDTLLTRLRTEYGKGNAVILAMIDRVLEEARNRIQTAELRSIVKKANSVNRSKRPEKFVSCDAYEAKKYEEVELWIAEGSSAAGAIKSARNSAFQAIYEIRGKGLNVTKASIKKVLANKEIRELFAILGTGFDLGIKNENPFNINNLKVGKIIIATDADEDGYQIRVLVFLIFYRLAPQLLLDGRVYVAETPRFSLELTDGTRVYARDDIERDRLKEEYIGRVKSISRYKGLGEVDANILRETTVHPDTRRLIPITCDLNNQTERDLIDALFGADKYKQRKSIVSTILGADVANMLSDNALLIGEIDDSDIDEEIEYEEVSV